MKKKYCAPVLDRELFETADVITASPPIRLTFLFNIGTQIEEINATDELKNAEEA